MTSSFRGGQKLIDKVDFLIVLESIYFFVFLATGAAEKLLISENRYLSGFQGHVGGIPAKSVAINHLLPPSDEGRKLALPPTSHIYRGGG